jgi:RimJ/RimL family protein N-acetyltransferase
MYTDVEIMRYIARPMSPSEALESFRATRQAMQMQSTQRMRFFVVERKADGVPLGVCAIQPLERRRRRTEIGLMLRREARRRSHGTQTVVALLTVTFEALPIDTVWVQYHPANVAAEKLFAGLGFLPEAGVRPRAARRGKVIRIMQRSAWEATTTTSRGHHMSSIISFLDSVGRNAELRHGAQEQLRIKMRRERVAPAMQAAVLNQDRAQIDALLGVTDKIYCANFTPRVPQKAPAKKPAKPGKKPTKKPAKKPAKKTPARKK